MPLRQWQEVQEVLRRLTSSSPGPKGPAWIIVVLAIRSPPRTDAILGMSLAELLRRLFEQQGRQLHRFDIDAVAVSNPRRNRLQALESSRGERD